MAKPKPRKRKRNIPDEVFKKMSGFERAEAQRQAGIKRGERKAGRIAGRSFYADAAKSRQGEAKGLRSKGSKYVARFNDPINVLREGGKEIESFNRRRLTSRMEKGKPVLIAGGEERMKTLRSLIQDVIKQADSKAAKNAARKALRAAKRLK
jgi:hypothetical protein